MKLNKKIEKWKRSYRKRFSKRNPAYYYVKRLLGNNQPVIFDVGANVGNITSEYLKDFPKAKIYCFEPNPIIFRDLHFRFKEDSRVQCLELGLSNNERSKTLNCNANADTSSFLDISPNADDIWQLKNTFQRVDQKIVSCSTLDKICKDKKIDSIDLLKLDCQGFERFVLQGGVRLLSNLKIKLIYTEVSFLETYQNQTKFHELLALLEKYNFELFNLYDQVERSAQIIQADALFINNVHKSKIINFKSIL